MPWLILWSRTGSYRIARLAGAAFASFAAAAWLVERVTARPNGISAVIDMLARHPMPLLALLIGGACVANTPGWLRGMGARRADASLQ